MVEENELDGCGFLNELDGCGFLIDNLIEAPLDLVEQHIADCLDCQETFAWVYGFYSQGDCDTFNTGEIPPGLNQAEFLRAWRVSKSRMVEVGELHQEQMLVKLATDTGRQLVLGLLWSQAIALKLAGIDATKQIMASAAETLVKRYEDLRGFLGHSEMACLMHQKPEEFALMIDGLRKLFSY